MNKIVTEEQLIEVIEKYRVRISNDKSVSYTKYKHMKQALDGCKMIVRDLFGSTKPQENVK